MAIKHANIIYVRDISVIGGVETYVYELVKKYKDLDIAVVYKTIDAAQLLRLARYCMCYKHRDEKIECNVAIINYDTSIIDYITKDIWRENLKEGDSRGIYQGIHADYENPVYEWKPPTDKRIKAYIGITKYIEDSFRRITGNDNLIQIYNPLTVEKNKKIILVSATRLSRIKGKNRMIRLIQALDNAGIDYLWFIFTNDTEKIGGENVIYMEPRLDIGWFMDNADYLVQLSDTEGLSYAINEMLYRNKPVIVTPLPYLEEIGVKDGVNAYIMEFDCSNVDDIVKKIKNIPKFEFKKLNDDYSKILCNEKSHYEEDLKKRVTCICKRKYYDMEHKRQYLVGDEIKDITVIRQNHLHNLGIV